MADELKTHGVHCRYSSTRPPSQTANSRSLCSFHLLLHTEKAKLVSFFYRYLALLVKNGVISIRFTTM